MDSKNLDNQKIVKLLREGKIGILPTDTIYGIHASVFIPEAIEKIYKIKKRDSHKPFVILISSPLDLAIFKIGTSPKIKKFLDKVWPGKISVILPAKENLFKYLHKGTKSLAIRIPDKPDLRKLLEKTGPLISTSANPEGKKPATTVEEAENYFGNNVDFYVNEGFLNGEPSTVVKVVGDKIRLIRKGAVKLKN